MKRCTCASAFLLLASGLASADSGQISNEIEEVIVTATPFKDGIADSVLPVGVLSGEELRRRVSNSLGATLGQEPGVHSASFGPGVGQPVIRGQSGKRVQVLQGGVDVTDASDISPDHAVGVEPLLADRIEVLRGPSTLLYGSGAIGGVVNVVDGRIPEAMDSGPLLQAEQSYDSATDENKTVVRLDTNYRNIAFHLDGVTRDNNRVEIPDYAIDVAALEALEALAHSDHADDEHHDDDEFGDNTLGFIGNSDGEGRSVHGGFSVIGDTGFIGLSVGQMSSNYGLPPGVHDHGHEDDHAANEGAHADEAGAAHDEEHADDAIVRLDMEQRRYDLKAEQNFSGGFIETVRFNLAHTDYEHSELEIAGGDIEIGTTYANKGTDLRLTVNHQPMNNLVGVWGVQLGQSRFSALGEEAFIPVSDIDSAAVFAVERYSTGRANFEFGARIERRSIDPAGACESTESSSSLSASMLYDLNEDSNVLVALSRSERPPTVEELFSNTAADCGIQANDQLVLHAATGLLEVGNPDLDIERSTNIEVGFRKHRGDFTASFNAYYNDIANYIYLDEAGEYEGEIIASYLERDTVFRGLEAEIEFQLFSAGSGVMTGGVFGDLVHAEFSNGDNVPRIPPARIGAKLAWSAPDWSASLRSTRFMDQDRAGETETPTPGYTMLSFYADYRLTRGDRGEASIFLRGDNLLDEDIRSHVSFLKNYAPEPGRGIRLGIRFSY